MRLYLLAMVVGACGFTPSGVNDVQLDAQQGSNVLANGDAGTGSGSATAHSCHVDDPSLRMCLDFEDVSLHTKVVDQTTHGHDGTATDVQPMRRLTQQAGSFGHGADVHVAESPDLDIPDNLTYEMWIGVSDENEASWPFDNYEQYTIGIADDTMFCYANQRYAYTEVKLGTDEWHHVACTYGNGLLKAYVDGVRVGCTSVSGPIANTNNGGTDLGQDFTGSLDDIHIYAAVLDEPTLAGHANAPPTSEAQGCAVLPY
jgi:Concanavalin A-like lectin/glucanases superfamily